MQPLARDGLSAAQVTALLQSPALEVSAGLELLAPDLSLVEDISDDLAGGKVSHKLYASIHGTCDLSLSRSLRWGVDLVRPYMTLSGAVSARFYVGVYCLTTPDRRVGQTPVTYAVQGFDRLYLLAREVGDTYEVAAGTEYLTAVRDAITAAGLSGILLDGSASGTVLPTAMVWPLGSDSPATWLRVVNDLLRAVNYRGVWCDEAGLFRSEPYAAPSTRPVEFTFDADDVIDGIVGEDRTVAEDVWQTPNRWVFVRQNLPGDPPPEPVDGAGVFIYDLPDEHPMSELNRGLRWAVTHVYDASSQADLESLGARRVESDLRASQRFDLTTGPFPAAGHADVFRYVDSAAGVDVKVQAVSWEFDLSGSDVRWVWERIG